MEEIDNDMLCPRCKNPDASIDGGCYVCLECKYIGADCFYCNKHSTDLIIWAGNDDFYDNLENSVIPNEDEIESLGRLVTSLDGYKFFRSEYIPCQENNHIYVEQLTLWSLHCHACNKQFSMRGD